MSISLADTQHRCDYWSRAVISEASIVDGETCCDECIHVVTLYVHLGMAHFNCNV